MVEKAFVPPEQTQKIPFAQIAEQIKRLILTRAGQYDIGVQSNQNNLCVVEDGFMVTMALLCSCIPIAPMSIESNSS